MYLHLDYNLFLSCVPLYHNDVVSNKNTSIMKNIVRHPNSLFCLVTEFFAAFCIKCMAIGNIEEALEYLPNTIKNEIIRKYTSPIGQKCPKIVDLISVLLNEHTYALDLTELLPLNRNIFEGLIKCKRLRRLYLSDDDLDWIPLVTLETSFQHLPLLDTLVLKRILQVTDEVVESVAENCPLLTAIDLTCCRSITNDGFKQLVKLKYLTWVKLSYTELSDDSISKIVQSDCGPKIRELRIDGCRNICNKGIVAIAENCPNIEVLVFDNCCSSLNNFQGNQFPNLKQLNWTITW